MREYDVFNSEYRNLIIRYIVGKVTRIIIFLST